MTRAARIEGLRLALADPAQASIGLGGVDPAVRLEPLPDSGLAHDHIRLVGTPWLARLPKQSQMDLPPEANLAYQAACFERAAAGGHSPGLAGRLPPGAALPRGGLLVQAIDGRPADLARPADRRALVEALASLHALPLPPAGQRPPLLDPPAPLADLAGEVRRQAVHLDAAGLAPAARRRLENALDAFTRHPALCGTDRCLIAFDAHPGNFLIEPDGRAVLVDLEKARYGHPGCDLAHATLLTSTTWPLGGGVALDAAAVLQACRHWAARMGAEAAGRWWPTLGLARQGMALWALTWCAKWRVLSARPAVPPRAEASPPRGPGLEPDAGVGEGEGESKGTGKGEDWSAEHSADALVAHVRERVDHYLDARTLGAVLDGCAALEAALARESHRAC